MEQVPRTPGDGHTWFRSLDRVRDRHRPDAIITIETYFAFLVESGPVKGGFYVVA